MSRLRSLSLWASLVLWVAAADPAAAADADPFRKSRQGRLSDALNRLSLASERSASPRASRYFDPVRQRVTAVIELASRAEEATVAAAVRDAGGTVAASAPGLLKVTAAPGKLRELSALPGVRRMRAPFYPSLKRRNDVVSEGVAVINADAYRSRTGATGAGVTVGVLDGGFKGVEDLLGSELPEGTRATPAVIEGLDSFESEHGTACAEIVHDVAPGAELVLATFEDEVTWSHAIDELMAVGARVISHSIGFDNLFPADGTSFFANKVDAAAAAGVLFVTAAGNEAGNYYQGPWRDADGDRFMEFGSGGAEMLKITAAPGATVVLRWDDPFGRSGHDYDLLVVTEDFAANPAVSADNPAIVAYSADAQRGADDPREVVTLSVEEPMHLYVVVLRDPASPPHPAQRFYLFSQHGVDPAFAVASGTLSLPADARGAVTVGAVAWDSRVVEGFSSRGPTSDGRTKPDLAAPDRVSTAAYGPGGFPGTSAATPHAAGAAALLLSRNPRLSVDMLRLTLERATTSGGSRKDNDTGYGLVDLTRAP